jgi:hypothetical protein
MAISLVLSQVKEYVDEVLHKEKELKLLVHTRFSSEQYRHKD